MVFLLLDKEGNSKKNMYKCTECVKVFLGVCPQLSFKSSEVTVSPTLTLQNTKQTLKKQPLATMKLSEIKWVLYDGLLFKKKKK